MSSITMVLPSPTVAGGGGGGGDAAADWTSRSTAAGVLWSQRFTNQASHIDRFLYATSPADGVSYTVDTTDGIIGDGCLKINVNAGFGDTGRWMRTMQPQPGDLNQPGVTVGPGFSTSAHGIMDLWQGAQNGYIAHASQQVSNPSAGTDGAFVYIGTEFYFQFRLKFSPGRFTHSTQMPTSKLIVFETNYQQVNHRWVMDSVHRNQDSSYYGGPYFTTYTAASGHGSFDKFEWVGPGTNLGPGGEWALTCQYPDTSSGKCAPVRENEWMTVLMRLKMGANLAASTVLEVKVAYDSDLASGYHSVINVTTADWLYDLATSYNASNSGQHPGGLNMLELTTFTGGGSITPAPIDYWTKFDQLIFSLSPIACPTVVAKTPAWLASVPSTLAWYELPGTTLDAAMVGYSSPGGNKAGIKAYSGCAVKKAGSEVFFAGGGHADYGGNEVLSLRLSADVPAWLLRGAPSSSLTSNAEYNADGKPASRHTAWHLQYSQARDKMFFFGGYALWGDGGSVSDAVDAFDPSTNTWAAAGTYANMGMGAYNVDYSVCTDAVGDVYSIRPDTGVLYKWDIDTATFSTVMTGPSYGYNAALVHDPVRNYLVRISDTEPGYYNLNSSGAYTSITPTGSSSSAFAKGYSAVWCNDRNSILLFPWSGTANIYEATWTGSTYSVALLSVSGTKPPNGDTTGCNRFFYAPEIGVVGVISGTSDNVWVFRTR